MHKWLYYDHGVKKKDAFTQNLTLTYR